MLVIQSIPEGYIFDHGTDYLIRLSLWELNEHSHFWYNDDEEIEYYNDDYLGTED